jgi:hypothetical protein
MTKLKTRKNNLHSISGLGVRPLDFCIVNILGSNRKIRIRRPSLSSETLLSRPNNQVLRILRWYEKHGDALVGETVLNNINLSELQWLFGETKDNLMFECYPLTNIQAKYLQIKLKQDFDLQSYAYFLECETD